MSETTTLFLDGVVYDFLKKPEQTAVFRKPGGGKPGQFILLNEQRSILTKFSTEQGRRHRYQDESLGFAPKRSVPAICREP